jgi:hypothetical protein
MSWINAAIGVVLAGVLAAPLQAGDGKARTFRFAKGEFGKVPDGWKATQTNKGANSSIWKVVADETAPSKSGFALAQTAESPSAVFNLCVATDTNARNVEVSVSFKAIKGQKDQGGGIVWRYQDANNYYVARMNPLEDNYRVYKVVDGKRIQLGTMEELKVDTGEWHILKIKMVGDHIECFLDGKKHLDIKDNAIGKAGQVGLWTKADAQTYFDNFVVVSRKE